MLWYEQNVFYSIAVKQVPLVKVPGKVPLHLTGARSDEAVARIKCLKCCLDSANVTVQLTRDSNHFALPPRSRSIVGGGRLLGTWIVCGYS